MRSNIHLLIATISQLVINNIGAYNGPIGGDKSSVDCFQGDKWNVPSTDVTPYEIITQQGYTAENHLVRTEDGYLLTLNRIPGPANAPAVLLHHGFTSTAMDWLIAGKDKSLAFLLADKGYDVWMANARGGLYSSCHVNYTTSDYNFWNFSFHEIGIYDIPAEIAHIKRYQNNSLFYIGHSMGTTAFYVMASERPDVGSKITLMFSLAPVAFFNHIKFPLRVTAVLTTPATNLFDFLNDGQMYAPSMMKYLSNQFCSFTTASTDICLFFAYAFLGYDYAQFNETLFPLILSHHMTPTAYKIKSHYLQLLASKRFQKYDYGVQKNFEIYKSPEPPEYDLSKIRLPIGLFWAENDFLSAPEDVSHLRDLLPLTILYHKVEYPNFNHLDYLFAYNAPEMVYSVLFDKMDIYR